jgi:hypothetical protein
MTICRRCGIRHGGKLQTCEACLVIMGGNHQYRTTPIQSSAESNWAEHVEDYRHERDWESDGRGSES